MTAREKKYHSIGQLMGFMGLMGFILPHTYAKGARRQTGSQDPAKAANDARHQVPTIERQAARKKKCIA